MIAAGTANAAATSARLTKAASITGRALLSALLIAFSFCVLGYKLSDL